VWRGGHIVKKVEEGVEGLNVGGNLFILSVACSSNVWVVTFSVEVVEIAIWVLRLMWVGGVPEAEGTVVHLSSGVGGGVWEGGVAAMVCEAMILSVSLEEAGVGESTVLEEIACEWVVKIGGGGVMKVMVMMGNPSRGGESIAMDHVRCEGILDMLGDVLCDNV
jgi:hypothetical protein